MNKNTKNQATVKKHKFTFIDGIVLFAVLAFICTLAIFTIDPFGWSKEAEVPAQNRTMICVMSITSLAQDDTEFIKAGDKVTLFSDENAMGKIVSVDITDEIIFTVEIECEYNEGLGYFINGEQLIVGATDIELQISYNESEVTMLGECLSIRKK